MQTVVFLIPRGPTDKSIDERRVSGGEEVQRTRCHLARLTLIIRKQSCSSTVKKQNKKTKRPPCENSRNGTPFLPPASRALPDAKGVRTCTVVYCPGGSSQL